MAEKRVEKRVLLPGRVRRPPATGFSWVDRRFVREHGESLSRGAVVLYLFLAAVSDKDGLSFWSESRTAAFLKLSSSDLVNARDELVRRDLVAHSPPLTQVLSLPEPRVNRAASEAETLGEILRRVREGRGP